MLNHSVVSDSWAPLSMGFFQARILEWVAISFLQGIFPTQGSGIKPVSCRFFIPWAIWGMTQHSFYSSPTELFLLHLCWFFCRIVSLYSVCIIWSLSPLCFSFFAFKESHSSPRLQLLRLQMPMVRASYANVDLPLNSLPRTSRIIQSITQSFLLHLPNYYWVHFFTISVTISWNICLP